MSKSLMGYQDRRVPQKKQTIHVQDSFDKIYKDAGVVMSTAERTRVEHGAYYTAMKSLEPQDMVVIDGCADFFRKDRKVKNFGQTGALEVLAKIGILLMRSGYNPE